MSKRITSITLAALLACSSTARADVVLNWNAIAVSTVQGQSPFAQPRFMAITQLAVFEAVNAITGDYKPYLSIRKQAPIWDAISGRMSTSTTSAARSVPAATKSARTVAISASRCTTYDMESRAPRYRAREGARGRQWLRPV